MWINSRNSQYIHKKYVLLKDQSSVYIEGAVMYISVRVYW